jgi:hypothetical protein
MRDVTLAVGEAAGVGGLGDEEKGVDVGNDPYLMACVLVTPAMLALGSGGGEAGFEPGMRAWGAAVG